MKMIGYARVSTSGQTLDAQLEQLGGAGCETVFRETFTGARSDRPQLHKALAAIIHRGRIFVLFRAARGADDLHVQPEFSPQG